MECITINEWKTVKELQGFHDLPNPPKKIYVMGKLNLKLLNNCVAIVGSRQMTMYGRQVLEKIIPQLIFQKKTIISGFMYGVDQYAHKIAIDNGGKTIAVLGWGIENKLDGKDQKLAEKILNTGGLIISEWKDQKATLWTFPQRNRIIVALSQEVIVIEAALKSGSLITAKIAEKLKRKLWAVPGPLTSHTSEGTNTLIAEGKAKMWIDMPTQNTTSNPLIKILELEPLTSNELARKTNKNIAQIGAELSLLALSGEVIEKDGRYYVQ